MPGLYLLQFLSTESEYDTIAERWERDVPCPIFLMQTSCKVMFVWLVGAEHGSGLQGCRGDGLVDLSQDVSNLGDSTAGLMDF